MLFPALRPLLSARISCGGRRNPAAAEHPRAALFIEDAGLSRGDTRFPFFQMDEGAPLAGRRLRQIVSLAARSLASVSLVGLARPQ